MTCTSVVSLLSSGLTINDEITFMFVPFPLLLAIFKVQLFSKPSGQILNHNSLIIPRLTNRQLRK